VIAQTLPMKNLLLASTSTIYGSAFLEYLMPELSILFAGVQNVTFVPYARPGGITEQEYTRKTAEAFAAIGIKVIGLDHQKDPKSALRDAEAIFTGGGNTFLLVKRLYELGLMSVLKEVLASGTPYLGTSAGTNICGQTMSTTNDMPIVPIPHHEVLQQIPFNINPHYTEPEQNSQHMGESRETRIREYLTQNSTAVIGLREGSWLRVIGPDISLQGSGHAAVFKKNKPTFYVAPGQDLNTLI
jgi:dipeptidase E